LLSGTTGIIAGEVDGAVTAATGCVVATGAGVGWGCDAATGCGVATGAAGGVVVGSAPGATEGAETSGEGDGDDAATSGEGEGTGAAMGGKSFAEAFDVFVYVKTLAVAGVIMDVHCSRANKWHQPLSAKKASAWQLCLAHLGALAPSTHFC
jgi:hypothetical protein